jgi:hypothetical protein
MLLGSMVNQALISVASVAASEALGMWNPMIRPPAVEAATFRKLRLEKFRSFMTCLLKSC